jgi:hypothetical protein
LLATVCGYIVRLFSSCLVSHGLWL